MGRLYALQPSVQCLGAMLSHLQVTALQAQWGACIWRQMCQCISSSVEARD